MNNGLKVDPLNPFTVAIKAITRKGSRKMTDADYAKLEELEWKAGLYWSEEDGLVMPGDNIEGCIRSGARKSRMGKDVEAAVFCSEAEVPIEYEGPRGIEELRLDPRFTLRKGVALNGVRVIRVRPMVPTGWRLVFGLEYDETIIDEKNLVKVMVDAGALCGLGDWRPKFGRFLVEVL
jgi:hypothetical protein